MVENEAVSKQDSEVSFTGKAIPDINLDRTEETSLNLTSPEDMTNKILGMSHEEKSELTVDKVHYDRQGRLSAVMLNSGDVISTETAIALAEQNALKGWSTGSNRYHQRTLRTVSSNPDDPYLHDYATF